ncbi:hypothetical protein Tco_0045096 [Tanacetum coccineum]
MAITTRFRSPEAQLALTAQSSTYFSYINLIGYRNWSLTIRKARIKIVPSKDFIMLPLWTVDPPFSQSSKSSQDDGSKPSSDDVKKLMKIQEKM